MVHVSRLKSGEKKSPPLQKAEVATVLLRLITRLRQKGLARTSNIKKAASIYNHYDANVHTEIAMSAYGKMLSLIDAKLGIRYKMLTIWAAKLSGYTILSICAYALCSYVPS